MKYLLLLILIILIESCDRSIKEELITIDPVLANDNVFNIDQITDIKFYDLSQSFNITGIKKFLLFDSLIIMTTFDQNSPLFIYDLSTDHYEVANNYQDPSTRIISNILDFTINCHQKSVFVSTLDGYIYKYHLELKSFEEPKKVTTFYNIYSLSDNRILGITKDREEGVVKIIGTDNFEIEASHLSSNNIINFVFNSNPITKWQNKSLLSISGLDTIYEIKEDNVTPILVVGANNSSTTSIDYNSYIKKWASNLGQQSHYSENELKVLIPAGDISNIGGNLIINLLRKKRQIFFNNATNESLIISPQSNSFESLIFRGSYIKVYDYKNGYYYSTTILNNDFHNKAMTYINKERNVVSEQLQELINKFQKDDYLEIPLIVKFKI